MAFAKGPRGVVMVVDLPEDLGRAIHERIWSLDGSGPRRFGIFGAFDQWLTAQVRPSSYAPPCVAGASVAFSTPRSPRRSSQSW